jgi:small-conductance mechanosensitive channel
VHSLVELFSDILPWAIGLVVGFPLSLLLLNELILRTARGGYAIASTLRVVRNLLLPTLAVMLFVRFVIERPAEDTFLRLVQTLLWVFVLFASLSFINDVAFGSAREGSWQSRVPRLFRDLTRFMLVAIGAAIIYSEVWGKELQGALTALGVGSIVIGLALQEPLGNVVSGLMLLFARPINLGDWVVVEGTTGKVIEINWRSVHIETATCALRIVPNSVLYKGSFSNLSRPTPLCTEVIDLSFSFHHPPNKVRQVLLDLMYSTPSVLAEPAPTVRTVRYTDGAVIYQVSFTVARQEDLGEARDAFMTRVWYAARRHALHIPVSTTSETPVDLLGAFPQFQLKDGGKEDLVTHLKARSFAAGERLMVEGQHLEGLYLVLRGSATLSMRDETGVEHEIARISRGEFFGENATLAGGASDLTVMALEDLDVLILAPEVIQRVLAENPRLAREFGNVLEVRRKAIQSARKLRFQE